jgi:D-alanyl-D-alanine carboxypeptidase
MGIKLRKRRTFLIIITVVVLLFDGLLGGMKYYYGQQLQKQQADAAVVQKKLDDQIATIKAKKAAEKKAAAQKAASDAALASQLRGQVVTPAGCAINGAHGNPNEINVIINKKHCFNPINFVPSDLVSYNGYLISAKIKPDLTAMFDAAAAAGVPLGLTSSYRSYTDQVATYNNWVKVNGSYAAADTVSARPGYSEHQTGLAIDLSTSAGCSLECFAGSAQHTWLQANAATYGFIERYQAGLETTTGYSPEAWHWRYVGPAVAQDMKNKGIKTLEQLWSIAGGGY